MTQEHGQGSSATLVAVRNGPGARLRAAREAVGFTQLEVAQQLRLSEHMIARLEEDNYDPNMPLVFVKGYLRSYSGLVGIDPEQIFIEFAHLGIKDPVRDVPDLGQSPERKLSNFSSGTPKHRPGLLWGSLAIFACGMLAFMYMYRDQIPALSGAQTSAASVTTTPSSEEAELNAALEAARQSNAQAAAKANAATAPVIEGPAPQTTAPVSSEGAEPDVQPMKPVSVNDVVVPSTRAAVKSTAKKAGANNTHETMLF